MLPSGGEGALRPFHRWKDRGPEKLRRVFPGYSVTAGTKGLVTCGTKESPGFFLLSFFTARPCNASFQDSNGVTGAQPHTVDDVLTSI